VKTAIVGFMLVCLIYPTIIKHRHQYYMALALFVLGLLFLVLGEVFSSQFVLGFTEGGGLNRVEVGRFWRVCHVIDGLLDIMVVILLVLASGGLSIRELAGNIGRAYEVMRRGETEKEVIIPLTGQQPKMKEEEEEEETVPQYTIDTGTGGEAEKKKADDGGSIPVE